MNTINVKVNAKINLSLNVTGISDNGYHYLDMVVASVDIADAIAVSMRNDDKITCKFAHGNPAGEYDIPDDSNSAVRAAGLIMREFGIPGVDIFVEKAIPVAGGLGGSSADAAGVILACAALFKLDIKSRVLNSIALKCGTDVLLQLDRGYKRVKGIGEEIEKLKGIPAYDIVIAKGSGGVCSRDSYNMYDKLNISEASVNTGNNELLINALAARDFDSINRNMHNDLFIPSQSLNPEITNTITALKQTGAIAVMMSGSGAACFGIYRDSLSAKAAAESLKSFEYVTATKTVI